VTAVQFALERLRWWHIEQVLAIEADLFGVEQWTAAMFWNELANDHHYIAALASPSGEERALASPAAATNVARSGEERALASPAAATNVARSGEERALASPAAATNVAQGEVLGYAGLAVAPPEAWINNIAVRRDQQRMGIGRQLLAELLRYGRVKGATHTLLEVAADNVPAQLMYGRHGFEVIGVRRGYYQPSNTDALVMRRDERT
jgi:ribosomal-protein-alanine N-acetyltransferase